MKRKELIKLVQIARKGSEITSGITRMAYWKFDVDSESKIVDDYLSTLPDEPMDEVVKCSNCNGTGIQDKKTVYYNSLIQCPECKGTGKQSLLPDENSHFLDDIRKEDDRGYFPNKSLPDVEGCTYPNRIDRFNACDMVYNKCCDCDYHKSNLTNHENREAKNS